MKKQNGIPENPDLDSFTKEAMNLLRQKKELTGKSGMLTSSGKQKMNNNKMVFWLIFIALSVLVSIFTTALWIGGIVFTAYILLSKGWEFDYLVYNRKYRAYLIRNLCAIALVGLAQWLDRSGTWWIWTIVWLVAGLIMMFAWILCHGKAPKWTSVFGVLGGLSVLFAVISPLIVFEFDLSGSTAYFLWIVIWMILLLGAIIFLFLRLEPGNPWKSRVSYILSFLVSLMVSLVSHKYWTGLIVFAGFWLLYKDIPKIMKGAVMKFSAYLFSQYGGFFLLIIAMYFTYAELNWIWLPICLMAGIPFYFTGAFIIKFAEEGDLKDKKLEFIGKIELATFLCCILFGLSTPGLLSRLPAMNVYGAWVLLFPGLSLLMLGSSEGLKEKSGPFLIYSCAGTLLMLAAIVVLQFSEVWMIRLFLGFGALATALGALGAFLERKMVGLVGGLISLLYFLGAVFGISTEGQFFSDKIQFLRSQPEILLILVGCLVLLAMLLLVIKLTQSKRVSKKVPPTGEIIPNELLSQLLKDVDTKKKR